MKEIICLLLFTTFCSKSAAQNNPVILISIDGFAHQYLAMYKPPFITSLIKRGVSSKGLKPVFPSKTFPNHLSIVTGKYPAEHGIVHNKFYHREIGKNYRLGDGRHDERWLTASPIWTIAEQQGIKTGVYFWPESEAKINGIQPSYYFPYKHKTTNETRLNQLIDWLKLPTIKRPKLLVSYISTLDSAGHDFGTQSKQVEKELLSIDTLLKNFYKRIEDETQLTPNLILVSDHGMVNLDNSKQIEVSSLLHKFKKLNVVNGQTQLFIYENNAIRLNDVRSHLTANALSAHYRVYSSDTFPTHWQLQKQGAAIPDLIVDAVAPYIFVDHKQEKGGATHGYDAELTKGLNAIFIANGPDINKNIEVPTFKNILVFDVLMNLLSLKENNRLTSGRDVELLLDLILIR